MIQPRAKNVTVIPQRMRPIAQTPLHTGRRRRVAAYARVSTDSEEQQTSYEAQVDYYTRYIHAKEETDNWEFVQVYTDEGISATNTKRREGFNAMVRDALNGKIDLMFVPMLLVQGNKEIHKTERFYHGLCSPIYQILPARCVVHR